MAEKSTGVQAILDGIISKLFLWAVPKGLKPNTVTYLRFIMTPFVYLLLVTDHTLWAFVLFIIAACTDFIDGAMARTRDQITDTGKLIDPIADKLLIGTVLYYVGFQYLVVKIFLAVIAFEILSVIFSAVFAYKIGRPVGANVFGKVKMVLQTLALFVFLLGLTLHQKALITTSQYLLYPALFFALISAIKQTVMKLRNVLVALDLYGKFEKIKSIIKRV